MPTVYSLFNFQWKKYLGSMKTVHVLKWKQVKHYSSQLEAI